MRKQYYFRPSPVGLRAWDVDRLIRLSAAFPRAWVPLDRIRELDEEWLGGDERATWRGMIDHIRLIEAADLSFPIILAADGRVMDGMHRVVKACLAGQGAIVAVQFDRDPEPDFVGKGPDDLPY
jgi:hypothetical protein